MARDDRDGERGEVVNWEDLPKEVLETMKELGHFSPTVDETAKELKGYTFDNDIGGVSKTYWEAKDLRRIAGHLFNVAEWLEARAEKAGKL